MQRYGNHSGQSGIRAYEIAEDSITLCFGSEAHGYRYTYAIPGRTHVEQMKTLALQGHGLATYVNQHVREHYAVKIPAICMTTG